MIVLFCFAKTWIDQTHCRLHASEFVDYFPSFIFHIKSLLHWELQSCNKIVLFGSSRGRSSALKSWFCCNVIKHLPKIQTTTERLIQIQYAGLGRLVGCFINRIFFCSFYDMSPLLGVTLSCGQVELSSEIQYWDSRRDALTLIRHWANIMSLSSMTVCVFRRWRNLKK